MRLNFNTNLVTQYKSPSQKIRVLSEDWVNSHIFCPSCGYNIEKYGNNRPVADFYCKACEENFELKSNKENNPKKIVNGAYDSMITRLYSSQNPNLFLLNYGIQNFGVLNFLVIPKHFFVPEIIEKRKPLSQNARRAGWIGCNILLYNIPEIGKIFFVKDLHVKSKEEILKNWRRTLFLREEKELINRSWILDIMSCIERINKRVFSLNDIYAFQKELSLKHPKNIHIKEKIRQQLQFLRDKGYLQFLERGKYGLL